MKYLFFTTLLCAGIILSKAKLVEKFSWKQLEFEWPSEQAGKEAISKGQYVPENNLPLGLERWNDKLFVTVPR